MEIYMFLFDGNHFIEIYIFLILWFYLMESICFYFMWKRTHFPLRDIIQEVLKFSEKQTVLAELVWRPTQLCRDVTSSDCIMSVSETIDSIVCYISFIVETTE